MELNKEHDRYQTFDYRWPHAFLNTRILAKIGFYYIGPSDQVQCFFCKVKVSHWEPEDNEVSEHRRWSPNCPLLKRRETSNIPCEPISELDSLLPPMSYDICGPCGIDIRPGSYAETYNNDETSLSLKHPDFPVYAVEYKRLKSFEKWPTTLKQTPEALSDAGFFYSQERDRVICFYCGGSLSDWDENDDPWEQHAKWFSKCRYVQIRVGIK